ncbi:MAG: ABC transporter permease [Kineosporiaceae bacterium]
MTAAWPRAAAYWFVSLRGRGRWGGFVATSLLTPLLYLAGIGFGIGTLVGPVERYGGATYAEFVAPGLLAAVAMQSAVSESTWPVMSAVRWSRQYHAQLATPLRVVDVLAGHAVAVATRLAVAAAGFWLATVALGLARPPWALLALPAAVLTGLAFAGPVMALSVHLPTDLPLTFLFRFVVVPLFLLGGVFAPVQEFPGPVQALVAVAPLWHGVELCRAASLGPGTWSPSVGVLAGHLAVLVAYAAAGWTAALVAYRRRLA